MSNYESTVNMLSRLASEALNGVQNVERKMFASVGKPANVTSARMSFTPKKPDLDKPPKFSDVLGFDDTTDGRMVKLDNEVDDFMNKFFPHLNQCLKTVPEEWLCGVITGNKPFGLADNIFETIWQRARDRESQETISQTRTLAAQQSARGFSMPQGSFIAAKLRLAKQQADRVGEATREAMIKEADIKKEILLFAEEQALRYKLGLMQVLGDFYKVWVTLPDLDTQRSVAKAQAWAAFYGALGDYYNVELAFEQLRLRSVEAAADVDIRNSANKINAASAASRDQGLGQAAQAFGQVAAGAASAASTLTAQVESF